MPEYSHYTLADETKYALRGSFGYKDLQIQKEIAFTAMAMFDHDVVFVYGARVKTPKTGPLIEWTYHYIGSFKRDGDGNITGHGRFAKSVNRLRKKYDLVKHMLEYASRGGRYE